MTQVSYRGHDVRRDDHPDGTILLRSGYGLDGVVTKTSDWLHHYAALTPDAVFLAERQGPGWREVSFGQALTLVQSLATGLLDLGLGPDRPILIMSGNGIDHGLLSLAAQYVGIPTVPVAEQYALIPAARGQLTYVAEMTNPGLVYAADGDRFGPALNLPIFDRVVRLVSVNIPVGAQDFADLSTTRVTEKTDTIHAQTGPDTLAKILMTSGSTSSPKGVLTTQRMMCTNQRQLQIALPFLTHKPPRIVDWLPWNHVFGGSHNFNMMLANGGSLYIDDGKPTPQLSPRTIENQRLKTGTLAFNVPVGFAQIRDAMRDDSDLCDAYFRDLDMLFYAGASLPQDVWADLEDMARAVRGEVPLFTSSWGLTETAPAAILQHEPTPRSGIVGVPLPGVVTKLIPVGDARFEVRVKGPSITPGYFANPEQTADAFDSDGFLITGDAMKFVDPEDMTKGLTFDGRISEDFKLLTGTWVRAAALRLDVLAQLGPLAQDVVITGADRMKIGLLIVPSPSLRATPGVTDDRGALIGAAADIAQRLAPAPTQGSSTRIARALILTEPPSIADGEITAKGNLNFRKILTRRADLLARLYDDADPATILTKSTP